MSLENEGTGGEDKVLDRRSAMESAFDDLAGGKVAPDATPDTIDQLTTKEDTSLVGDKKEEQVIKPDDKEKVIVDDAKKPLKALSKKVGEKTGKVDDGKEKIPTKYRAPGSWKPEEREKWTSIPEDIQAAIIRRESEVSKAFNDTNAARRWSQEFLNIVKPYETLIRSSGATPMQAVSNLMATAAGLQQGTPAQKAGIIARLVGIYGVDLNTLDRVLAGQAPTKEVKQEDAVARMLDQRLKPVMDFIGNVQNTRQNTNRQMQQEVQQTADEFSNDPANEFYDDLREDMADLLETAAKRGRAMTLKEAYDRAATLNPDISKIVSDRAAAAVVKKNAQSLDRSRRAASSQPAGSPGATGVGANKKNVGTVRSALSAAWDDLSAG